MLSPRVLYFGPQELIYDCMESRKCECSFVNYSNPLFGRRSEFRCAFVRLNHERHPEQSIMSLWKETITEYSRPNLTYASDVCHAIAGTAKACQKVSKSMLQACGKAPALLGIFAGERRIGKSSGSATTDLEEYP